MDPIELALGDNRDPENDKIKVEVIEFTDRKIGMRIGRTIKTDDVKYEFVKFDLMFDGTIPDGSDHFRAYDQVFRDLFKEMSIREAVVRAIGNNSKVMGQVVELLKKAINLEEINASSV